MIGPPSGAAETRCARSAEFAVVEEVARVERAVAQELVGGAVELVRAGGGDDVDLRAGTLAVLRAVGVLDHGEFAHRVHAQKLSAGSARACC